MDDEEKQLKREFENLRDAQDAEKRKKARIDMWKKMVEGLRTMTRPRPTEEEIEAEREIANAQAVFNARHTCDKMFDITKELMDEQNETFATWDMQIQVKSNPTYADRGNRTSLIIIAQRDDEIDVRTELIDQTDTSIVHDIQLMIPEDFGDRRYTSSTIPKTVTMAAFSRRNCCTTVG